MLFWRWGTQPPAKSRAWRSSLVGERSLLGEEEEWSADGRLGKITGFFPLFFIDGISWQIHPVCAFLCGITKLECCFSMNMKLLKNKSRSALNSAGLFEATKRRLFCWEMLGLGTWVFFVRTPLCSSWHTLSTTPRFARAVKSGHRGNSDRLWAGAKRGPIPSRPPGSKGQPSPKETLARVKNRSARKLGRGKLSEPLQECYVSVLTQEG